jgi:hypothetical protein
MMPERDDVHPPIQAIRPIVTLALEEDLLPLGDLTSMLLDATELGEARFVARRARRRGGDSDGSRGVSPSRRRTFVFGRCSTMANPSPPAA